MPHLAKPHFTPSTLRSQFSPERALPQSSWSQRMTFELDSPSLSKSHPAFSPTEDLLHDSSTIGSAGNSGRYSYIPKPKGEFNRPSNGYTLETMCKNVLGWDADRWQEVEVFLGILVDENLDLSIPRTQQTAKRRQLLYEKMLKKFDFFAQFDRVPGSYDHNWLLNDLVARRLKKKDLLDATKQPSKNSGRKTRTDNAI